MEYPVGDTGAEYIFSARLVVTFTLLMDRVRVTQERREGRREGRREARCAAIIPESAEGSIWTLDLGGRVADNADSSWLVTRGGCLVVLELGCVAVRL
jgi:hypothetical protein